MRGARLLAALTASALPIVSALVPAPMASPFAARAPRGLRTSRAGKLHHRALVVYTQPPQRDRALLPQYFACAFPPAGNTDCARACVSPLAASGYLVSGATRAGMKVEDLSLTPELSKLTRQFAMVPDPKLRYQQLLFFAAKLGKMDSELQIEDNKVKGCQSTVYVHATKDGDGLVHFTGKS